MIGLTFLSESSLFEMALSDLLKMTANYSKCFLTSVSGCCLVQNRLHNFQEALFQSILQHLS